MAIVTEPRRQCDNCKLIQGDSVKQIEVAVFLGDTEESYEVRKKHSKKTLDLCPKCLVRLDTAIVTGTSPVAKRKATEDVPEGSPGDAEQG